jgi:hypothetical protein
MIKWIKSLFKHKEEWIQAKIIQPNGRVMYKLRDVKVKRDSKGRFKK